MPHEPQHPQPVALSPINALETALGQQRANALAPPPPGSALAAIKPALSAVGNFFQGAKDLATDPQQFFMNRLADQAAEGDGEALKTLVSFASSPSSQSQEQALTALTALRGSAQQQQEGDQQAQQFQEAVANPPGPPAAPEAPVAPTAGLGAGGAGIPQQLEQLLAAIPSGLPPERERSDLAGILSRFEATRPEQPTTGPRLFGGEASISDRIRSPEGLAFLQGLAQAAATTPSLTSDLRRNTGGLIAALGAGALGGLADVRAVERGEQERFQKDLRQFERQRVQLEIGIEENKVQEQRIRDNAVATDFRARLTQAVGILKTNIQAKAQTTALLNDKRMIDLALAEQRFLRQMNPLPQNLEIDLGSTELSVQDFPEGPARNLASVIMMVTKDPANPFRQQIVAEVLDPKAAINQDSPEFDNFHRQYLLFSQTPDPKLREQAEAELNARVWQRLNMLFAQDPDLAIQIATEIGVPSAAGLLGSGQ